MLAVYRRGRIWWLRGSVSGRRIRRRSLDTRDYQVAELRCREIERDILTGHTAVLWADFSGEFLEQMAARVRARQAAPGTEVKYRFIVKRFSLFLARSCILRVDAIDSRVISAFTEDRQCDVHPTRGIPVGPEGQKSDLRMLRAIFNQAVERGYLRSNPVRGANLNAAPRSTQPFSKEEINRMLSGPIERARPDLRAILLCFLSTGFRISDVEGLEKREVDIARNRIIRRTIKRGKTVSLPLHPALRSELEAPRRQTFAQRASPLVFPTRTGRPMRKLDGILRAHFRRCGIAGGHAHRFRDTFSVGILEQGGSLYDVARLLGITVAVAERHYSPYAQELQDRGSRLVLGLPFSLQPVAQQEHAAPPQSGK